MSRPKNRGDNLTVSIQRGLLNINNMQAGSVGYLDTTQGRMEISNNIWNLVSNQEDYRTKVIAIQRLLKEITELQARQ